MVASAGLKTVRSGMLAAAGVLTIISSCLIFLTAIIALFYAYDNYYLMPLLLFMVVLFIIGFALGLTSGILILKRKVYGLCLTGVITLLVSSVFTIFIGGIVFLIIFGVPILIMEIIALVFIGTRLIEFGQLPKA